MIRYLSPLAIVAFAAAFALFGRPLPPRPVEAAPAPATTREAWAVDLLGRLGNDAPTAETIGMIVQWTRAEDSGDDAFSRNNPLNTTMCGFNQVSAINSDGACGVASYATCQDGLDATIATLAGGAYVDIVAALQSNDPERAKRALWVSPWAESHYGYGAKWPKE